MQAYGAGAGGAAQDMSLRDNSWHKDMNIMSAFFGLELHVEPEECQGLTVGVPSIHNQ